MGTTWVTMHIWVPVVLGTDQDEKISKKELTLVAVTSHFHWGPERLRNLGYCCNRRKMEPKNWRWKFLCAKEASSGRGLAKMKSRISKDVI